MKTSQPFLFVTQGLLASIFLWCTTCVKVPQTPPAPAENPQAQSFRAESEKMSGPKDLLNQRNLDAMNLQIAAHRKLRGGRLTWQEVLGALPSPATEIYSGRSTVSPSPDRKGGWWWDESKQHLEINRLP